MQRRGHGRGHGPRPQFRHVNLEGISEANDAALATIVAEGWEVVSMAIDRRPAARDTPERVEFVYLLRRIDQRRTRAIEKAPDT